MTPPSPETQYIISERQLTSIEVSGTCRHRTHTANIVRQHPYSPKDTDTQRIADVIVAANEWFDSKRPCDHSEEQQMENPTVNCVTEEEDKLAKSIALQRESKQP